ncbi:hypothetical protein ACF0H5_018219 [Mactra antiquata]
MFTKIFLCIILFGIMDAKDNRKDFKYTVNNVLQDPRFTESIILKIKPRRYLIDYMEEACRIAPTRFTNFTATYFPSVPGYLINAINGVAGNYNRDHSFWQILNKGVALVVGVSQYIPRPRDNIMFNLTDSATEHH